MMRHLYKYNESKDLGLIDYCKDAFQDFIDFGAEIYDYENNIYVNIESESPVYEYDNFEDFYEYHKRKMDQIEDINVSIKRIKDKADINVSLHYEDNIIVIQIKPLSNLEKGEFYDYDNRSNGVKIHYDKLKKILGLPKSVSIGLSTSGKCNFINFNFKTKELLDQYSEKVIKDFAKIEIKGSLLNGLVTFGYNSSTGDIKNKYEIRRDYKQTYHNNSGSRTETINQVVFGLNKKFDYEW